MSQVDPREAKLSVWAQKVLARLRRKIEDLETQIRELRWENPNSDTFVEPRVNESRPLPRGETVRFQLGEHDQASIEVRVARERNSDDVYLHVMGLDGITIHPMASNVVEIRMDR